MKHTITTKIINITDKEGLFHAVLLDDIYRIGINKERYSCFFSYSDRHSMEADFKSLLAAWEAKS